MRVKVPLFRTNPVRSALIETEATVGAVVGENLYDAAGNLVDLDAMIAEAVGDASGTGTTTQDGSDLTTDDVEEGRYNEYFTDARADARIAAHDTFPFFLADGTPAYIRLTSDLHLPFFDSTGGANNIALTA
jgi:hypothetical protein